MSSNFKSFGFNLSETPQVLYSTANGKVAIVIFCQAANKSENNQSVILDREDALRNVTASLAPSVVVPSHSAIALLTGKLALLPGDNLVAYAAVDGAIDITISIMEMTQSV